MVFSSTSIYLSQDHYEAYTLQSFAELWRQLQAPLGTLSKKTEHASLICVLQAKLRCLLVGLS